MNKLNQSGATLIIAAMIVVVALVVVGVGWYVLIREKREPYNFNDTGQPTFLEASIDECVNDKKSTSQNISGVTDRYYDGNVCTTFVEKEGEPEKLIVGLTFPTQKDKILKAGYYTGTCDSVKEQVYGLSDVVNGTSGSAILVGIEEFARGNKNPDTANGQLNLVVYEQSDTTKPVACAPSSI